jgi:hypothetical protein
VGLAASFSTQDGYGGVGSEVLVRVEPVGVVVEEGVAGEVRGAGRVGVAEG